MSLYVPATKLFSSNMQSGNVIDIACSPLTVSSSCPQTESTKLLEGHMPASNLRSVSSSFANPVK